MDRVELGELALALGRVALRLVARLAGQLVRPAAEALGADRGGLQGVNPADHARQQPGRVAPDLVAAERQVVDAVEQDSQPLGRAQGLEERVHARLGRMLAQQAHGGDAVGVDGELLEGLGGRFLGAGAQVARSRMRARQGEGLLALPGEVSEPEGEGLGPPRPRDPSRQQDPLSVVHDRRLRIDCTGHRARLPRDSWPWLQSVGAFGPI